MTLLTSKSIRYLLILVLLASMIAACQSEDVFEEVGPIVETSPTPVRLTPTPTAIAVAPTETSQTPAYLDPSLPVEQRVEDLLARMTLAEKIGQMTQVEKNSMVPNDVASLTIGSVLSGGDGTGDNSPEQWRNLADGFQRYALQSRLRIPLIFGVDAIHGHGHVYGATIFPQNIGLGATRDPDLIERIGRATAEEMAATSIRWNFAPVVAVPQDIRWGRTYEGFSENTDLVTLLGAAYVRGLQNVNGREDLSDPLAVLATPKHYLGDGGTKFGTSTQVIFQPYLLDQGDMQVDEATVRQLFLPPYQAAIEAGAKSIMVSFSSWQGKKMHAHKYLLTDVLKGELGFTGFLISDWQAIDQLPGDYYSDIVTSINAGLDMNMVPTDYHGFIDGLTRAVNEGKVPMERIDDAVRRILTVKFEMGLFEHPYADPALLSLVGNDAHRALAREAVRKSLVLLKNDNQTLPLSKDTPLIFVAGQAADDIGIQSGGWTIEWQGKIGGIQPGTTILEGIRQTVSSQARVEYNRFGQFDSVTDAQGNPLVADVGIVVVGEPPYAEGVGDRAELALSDVDIALINHVKTQSRKVIVVLISGRPLAVTEHLPEWDAFVAAWLPGTEGGGVADVLFGDYPFTGKLPYSWPRWNSQLPLGYRTLPTEGCEAPLFPFGYGLDTGSPSPAWPDCPPE
ncbi:MAG TPA: glycoside hydrolase family 3 N-terminal domain-containing protein [Anaerolineae bacterium]